MKRKFLTVFLAVMATLCMVFALSACDLFGSGGKSTGSGTGNSGTQTEQGGNTQKPNEGGQGSTEPEKKEFTVTFNANGGEFEDGKSAFSVSVKENETLSLPEEPTRDKYEFVQWCTDSSLETAWDFSTPVTRAMTLYADWKALVTEFDVTFILNYEGAENVVRSTENGLVTFIPERADYVFNGWWLSDGLTESGEYILSQKWDTAEPVTEAGLRLVAEWVEKATASMQLPAPSVTINEAVFSWEAIAGAKEYDIRVYKAGSNTEETKDRTDGTTWTFPSGFDAGYYTVKIRALGDGMTTVNSAFVSKSYGHLILSKISEINFDISTSILTWTAVRKATSYVLYIDSVETKTLSYTSFDMSAYEAGSHSVQITAKRNGYQSSTVTTTVEKKRLKTPEVTVTKEDTGEFPYTITWQPVAHADTYILTLNGAEHRFTDKTSYTFDRFGDWGEERMIKISLSAFDSYADYAVSNPFTAETEQINVIVKTVGDGGTATLENGGIYGFFTSGATVNLIANTKLGYTFAGWYQGSLEISSEPCFSFLKGKKNVICEAQWTLVPGMDDFLFVSTQTSCTITGVKDKNVMELLVPQCVTHIQEGALKDCKYLVSLSIPFVGDGFDKTHFGYIFGAYNYQYNSTFVPSSLRHVTITGGSEIGDMAFFDCTGLAEVIIPNSVTAIGKQAFFNCSALTEITIPFVGNGSNEKHFDYIFGIIPSSLKKVIVTGGSSIGDYAFYDCSGLTEITIPNSVTEIGTAAFWGCSGLEKFTIPDSVAKIENQAFYFCGGLKEITIPQSVVSIGILAFNDCSRLSKIEVEQGNPIYKSENNCIIEISTRTLVVGCKDSIIPDDVTSIGEAAFDCCFGLTSIIIPHSVTSIGKNAFRECSKLLQVWNYSLMDIQVGKETFGYVAYYAKHVYTEDTPSKQIETADGYIFYEEGDESFLLGYTGIETKLALPAKSPTGKSYAIYHYAFFDYRYRLTGELKIPDSVTSIGFWAFAYSELTSVTIGSDVTSIGYRAFYGCSGLTSIDISDSVTAIGDLAFEDCSGLTEITIPNSVTSIGRSVFSGCSGLEKVYFENPNGWKVSGYSDMRSPTDVSGLDDPATAAKYLRDTYPGYYWKRYD